MKNYFFLNYPNSFRSIVHIPGAIWNKDERQTDWIRGWYFSGDSSLARLRSIAMCRDVGSPGNNPFRSSSRRNDGFGTSTRVARFHLHGMGHDAISGKYIGHSPRQSSQTHRITVIEFGLREIQHLE